jgi:hypothetical protein
MIGRKCRRRLKLDVVGIVGRACRRPFKMADGFDTIGRCISFGLCDVD